jgi:hypothetical protein
VIEDGSATMPIVGRLLEKGLYDELNGETYAVIDGVGIANRGAATAFRHVIDRARSR